LISDPLNIILLDTDVFSYLMEPVSNNLAHFERVPGLVLISEAPK